MFDEARLLFEEVQKLNADERGPFVTWLVIELIRDVSYYLAVGLVVFGLGKRLINAIQAGMREARRGRA